MPDDEPLPRLIVLRGASASGKTTTALALRATLVRPNALLQQDFFRRELLHRPDGHRSKDVVRLLEVTTRAALDCGYDVILEGILSAHTYSDVLNRLATASPGGALFYQYDLDLEETLRRHETRDLAKTFGTDKIRRWYRGWDPLTFVDEKRVGAGVTANALVRRIQGDVAALSRHH